MQSLVEVADAAEAVKLFETLTASVGLTQDETDRHAVTLTHAWLH